MRVTERGAPLPAARGPARTLRGPLRVSRVGGSSRRLRGGGDPADDRAVSASFRFRLEPVRRVRQRAEDDAKADLADALRREGDARRRHEAAVARERAARGQHRRQPGQALSGADLRAGEVFLLRTADDASRQELELERQIQESLARRALLADAARDRQALDRLRERRLADHEAHERRVEQDQLDEIALVLHRRSAA